LWRYESGQTRFIRADNLGMLAAALRVRREALATYVRRASDVPAHSAGRDGATRPPSLVPAIPPPPAEPFAPRVLQSLATAFRVHEGRHYRWTGRVESQAPISRHERTALGCRRAGTGARFVVRVGAGAHARVAVHAVGPEATAALQSCFHAGRSARLTVRVVVVEDSQEHATVSDESEVGPSFHQEWCGFICPGSEALVPWALVVVEVAPAARSRARRVVSRR
jgi:hypothetical protein